jgi:hypothetical protein
VSKGVLKGHGCLVDDRKTFRIEIVRWPAQGRRPIDENSGDQGGVAEGLKDTCRRAPRELRASITLAIASSCSAKLLVNPAKLPLKLASVLVRIGLSVARHRHCRSNSR